MISKNDEDKVTESKPKRSLYALIMTLCGVHGTISLAIALTLPYLLANHETFAYRNDLLFIASGMVILSLIIAQVILPLVTPDSPKVKIGNMSFKEARIYILEHVIDYLNQNRRLKRVTVMETSLKITTINSHFKTVEKEDENSKELERLQKIAFNVETKR